MTLLKTINITKIYLLGIQSFTVLKNISIEVEKGEILSIVGKSGSGKTTLMNILGCLDIPTSGNYLIEDKDVSHMNVNQLAQVRNKKIGFVFQRFNLLANITALDNVILPQLYAGKLEADAKKEAIRLLEMIDLGNRINHFPAELSGGEQQRVAIARSLANNPSILLADEPTGNLDSATGTITLNLFKHLNKKYGVTVIIITHDQNIADETNRIIRLHDGQVIEDRKI